MTTPTPEQPENKRKYNAGTVREAERKASFKRFTLNQSRVRNTKPIVKPKTPEQTTIGDES